MKFRALNFDYHAEAKHRDEQRRRETSKASFRFLMQAGSYESAEKASQNEQPLSSFVSTNTNTSNESISPISGVDEVALRTRNTVVARFICNGEGGDVSNDTCVDATALVGASMEEDVEMIQASRSTRKTSDISTSAVIATANEPHHVDLIKTKRTTPRFLTANELLYLFNSIQKETQTLRLAYESWHDDIRMFSRPNETPKLLFWREPAHFLSPATYFLYLKCILPPWLSSSRRATVGCASGTPSRVFTSNSPMKSPNSSYSLLNSVQATTKRNGLQRISKSGCAAQLLTECTAIVPYTGPLKSLPPVAHMNVHPSTFRTNSTYDDDDAINAVQKRMATLPHNSIVQNANGNPKAENVCEPDEAETSVMSGSLTASSQKRNTPSLTRTDDGLDTSIPSSSSNPTGMDRSPPISFADFVKNSRARKKEVAITHSQQRDTPADSKVHAPPEHANQLQEVDGSSATLKRRGEETCNNQQDEVPNSKKKRNSEWTSEEKNARKMERKARKKDKRREEKKRNRQSPEKTCEPSKVQKTTDVSAVQPNVEAKLLRSVVAKASVRRSAFESVDDELDRARCTLHNKARESRKAFSQMKVKRDSVPHAAHTQLQYFQQHTNSQPSISQSSLGPDHFSKIDQKNPHSHPHSMATNSTSQHMSNSNKIVRAPSSASNPFQGRQRLPSTTDCKSAALAPIETQPHSFAQINELRSSQQNDERSAIETQSRSFAQVCEHRSSRQNDGRSAVKCNPPEYSLSCRTVGEVSSPFRSSLTKNVPRLPSVCTGDTAVRSHQPGHFNSSSMPEALLSQIDPPTRIPPRLLHKMSQGKTGKPYHQQMQVMDVSVNQQQKSGENPFQLCNDPHNVVSPGLSSRPNGLAEVNNANATRNDVSLLPPVKLLCSEAFLESWGEIVAELASGRWAKLSIGNSTSSEIEIPRQSSPEGRRISLIDTPLVSECGVDIEASGRYGFLVVAASELESVNEAKRIVLKVAELAAIGRYVHLFIFLCYNVEISPDIARRIVQLQCAAASSNGSPPTKVSFKTATRRSLSASLAHTILSCPKLTPDARILGEATIEAATDNWFQERAHFLISLLPVLSTNGAIQCLLLAKKLLPPGSPFFEMLFKNQRLRQQIMLTSTSDEKGAEVHPSAMVQFSRVLRVYIGKGSRTSP